MDKGGSKLMERVGARSGRVRFDTMTPVPKYFGNLDAISCNDRHARRGWTHWKKHGGRFIRSLLFASTGKRAQLVAPMRMTKMEPILGWE